MKKNQYLYEGTEVVTDDLRIGFVNRMQSPEHVVVRFHSPPWPFPEMAIKQRCQLTKVPIEYEEAMF